MSGRECIRKTNKEVFGWVGKVIPFLRSSSGSRWLIYAATTIALICLEVWAAVEFILMLSHSVVGLLSVFLVTAVLVASGGLGATILIYAVTLWDNCEKG